MTTAVASATVAIPNAYAEEGWAAESVAVSEDSTEIIIRDQTNTSHKFTMTSIKDLYFRPTDEDPDRLVLTIWTRPDNRSSDLVEKYAGLFDLNGEPRRKIKGIVDIFHLVR
jgi:hypothetical protein